MIEMDRWSETDEGKASGANEVRKFVSGRLLAIRRLAAAGREKALLAELRRGIGRVPGDAPKLWGFLFEEMPEAMMSRGKDPTREEWAIYTALTLYAFHQQGKDALEENMHVPEQSIGCAVGSLARDEDESDRIQVRWGVFATSSDMAEAAVQLRALVSLLRAESIGFDYAGLAKDLYEYQFQERAKSVRLRWGQDFYKSMNKLNKLKEDEENG